MIRSAERYTHYPRTILWLVPGGEVTIGGREADSRPPFGATVEPFYISKLPITNQQFEAYDPGFEPDPASPRPDDPAVAVSWHQADAYARWYAEVSRKPMRLPSEVEWEHACRGGARGRWPWDDDPETVEAHLWHRGNSGQRLPRLDHKKANPFGLWAMLGGVWEWTASPYRPYPLDAEAGEDGESGDGERLVLRGGSFRLPADEISCSRRRAEAPGYRAGDVGFRIVKSLRRG